MHVIFKHVKNEGKNTNEFHILLENIFIFVSVKV